MPPNFQKGRALHGRYFICKILRTTLNIPTLESINFSHFSVCLGTYTDLTVFPLWKDRVSRDGGYSQEQ